ncbi:MAG: beta-lactamase family protein [Bradymonadaceae bacterium]|nr:beta-lactamase family protein [Lujinxingiaceae bacterium]
MDKTTLHDILAAEIASELDQIGARACCSAAQAIVWQRGTLVFDEALGHIDLSSPSAALITASTPMDIASVTKALVTATLAMQAVDEGLVDWDTPLSRLVERWQPGDARAASATLLHLLNHSSGLPAWVKFYERFPLDPDAEGARATHAAVIAEIAATPLVAAPGQHYAYSDLGYILLGHILEQVFSAPLDRLARARIFSPLGMAQSGFVSTLAGDRALLGAAATERCALRGRLIVGTVHDENTNIQGGVAGHAGVFSTAQDLLRFATHLLAIDHGERPERALVSAETLAFCWSEAARGADGSHLGGWDTPSGASSSAGRGFSAGRSVGHLGFTGSSLWIERDSATIAVLLTNRVYPTRQNERIKALRIAFHEAILAPAPSFCI